MPEQLAPGPPVLQVNPEDLRQVAGVFSQLRDRLDGESRRAGGVLADAALGVASRQLADRLSMAAWDAVGFARQRLRDPLGRQRDALLGAADRFERMDQSLAARIARLELAGGPGGG